MMDGMYASQAYGQQIDRAQNRIMHRFDQDGSGDISVAEASDFGRMAQQFTQMDADDDGRVTGTELRDQLVTRAMEGRGPMGADRMNALGAWMQIQEENQAVAAFDQMDGDSSGALSDSELIAAIEAQVAAAEAAQARQSKINEMARMDLDGNGQVSVEELQAELQLRADNRAVAEFDRLDTDGDGALSDAELAAEVAVQDMPPAEAEDTADMTPMPPVADPDPAPATDPDLTTTDMTTPMEDPMAPAETAPGMTAAASEAEEPEALSLIENVFESMLEDSGLQVGMDKLMSMSQSLYAEAQEILMDQITDLGSDDDNAAA